MNISKFNEAVEREIQTSYLGLDGIPDFNRDRAGIFRCLINDMFKRTCNMFEYKNLPETLSPISLEKYLQGAGSCLIVDVKQEQINNPEAKPGIYALPCKPGGRMNANYVPTTAVVSNSWLSFSATYDLEKKEAVLGWNDSLREGLNKLFSLYASELVDNIQTLHFQEVHNRILSVIKASDENERKDAEGFFEDFENGKFAALGNEEFINNLKNNRVDPFKGSSNSSIKETLEARQWLLAHWNIELGLNDNYNMKRESLNENEIEANADTLTPLLDDMMKCRKKMVEELNEIYGLDISVEFSSSWKRVHKREQNAQKVEDAETEIIENQAENTSIDDVKDLPQEEPAAETQQESEEVK